MLSRFAKLPGFSKLSSTTSAQSRQSLQESYEKDALQSAISEIKKLGKSGNGNSQSHNSGLQSESLQSNIGRILSLMRKFEGSVHVQRVACHAISNLAMQVMCARDIIEKGGFTLIESAIERFIHDFKLCWLASSAVWNLARPPSNRGVIGIRGVNLMTSILNVHFNKEKVANTAIGALSNLSLNETLKDAIANNETHLKLILSVLHRHLNAKHDTVMTSGAGLLANLAVNDEHATKLVECDALHILCNLLAWHSRANNTDDHNRTLLNTDTLNSDHTTAATLPMNHNQAPSPTPVNAIATNEQRETLYRNTCAALNNLVTANGFLESFLLNCGIEKILSFLEFVTDNNSHDMFANLLENCLIHIDADMHVHTTSYHLAAYHSKLDILKHLIECSATHKYNVRNCLNTKDGHGMTMLDYACVNGHLDIVEFLVKLGCDTSAVITGVKTGKKGKEDTQTVQTVVARAKRELKECIATHHKTMIQALPQMPTDVCKFMVSFQHEIDMLKAMNMY